MKKTAHALIIASVALLSLARPVCALELNEFYRGMRAMGMGNTYTAVADDLDSVFYNPAGLALLQGTSFVLLNPKIDVSGDVVTPNVDLMANTCDITLDPGNIFQDLNASNISKLFGKNLYGNATVFPAAQYKNLVVGYYYGVDAHISAQNLSYPVIDARYVRDQGFIAGFGYETRGFRRGQYLRMGLTGKYLIRQGLDKTIPISEIVQAPDKSYLDKFISASETGIGIGLGLQYEIPLTRIDSLVLGSAWQDIGDTRFGASGSSGPPAIPSNLAAGLVYTHFFGSRQYRVSNFKLAGEMRHLSQANIDPRLKMHLGAEFEVGGFSMQTGLNQDSITAGMALDMSFLKIAAVTYGVENSTIAFVERERRYALQLTVKFDLLGKDGKSFRERERMRRRN